MNRMQNRWLSNTVEEIKSRDETALGMWRCTQTPGSIQ